MRSLPCSGRRCIGVVGRCASWVSISVWAADAAVLRRLVNTPAPAVRCAFMRRQFSAGGVSGGLRRPRCCTGRGVVVMGGIPVSFKLGLSLFGQLPAFNAVLCAVMSVL